SRDSTDGQVLTVSADGTADTTHFVPGGRHFGMLAPLAGLTVERLPSGLTRSTKVTRPMSADYNPPDPTNHWIEEGKINGRPDPFRTEFNSATSSRLLTLTTPEGRVATAIVDSAGRPLRMKVGEQDTLRMT